MWQHRDTQTQMEESHVKTETETGVTLPKTKCLRPPEAGSKGGILPTDQRGSPADTLILDFQPPDL